MNNNLKVCIAFPEVSDVRIGTALRISITYFQLINRICKGAVPRKRLDSLLKELPYVYKYKSVSNYVNHVSDELLFMNMKYPKIDMDLKSINDRSEKYGEKIVPLPIIKYFNYTLLPKLVNIAKRNMKEGRNIRIYPIVISKKEYISIYSEYMDTSNSLETALKFIEAMISWLEYNLILRVENVYIDPKTEAIIFPVKFSFLDKSKKIK